MTITLRLLILWMLFHSVVSFADCASYYQELNQKILAHQTDGLIKNEEDFRNFIQSTEELSAKDRLIFLKRLMELAKKDFDLATDFARVLNELSKKGLLTKSNLEEIVAINSESKIVFTLNSQTLKLTSNINLPPEALINASLIPEKKWEIINLNLPLSSQEKLVQTLLEISSKKNTNLINSALNFMTSLTENERVTFANDFKKILELEKSNLPLLKKFRKNYKKFNEFENRTLKEVQKDLKQNGPKLSEEEYLEQAKINAKTQRRIYENLSYGCKGNSGTTTVNQQVAAAKFKRFRTVLGLSTNISMYAYANWDKDKDLTWFSKLGYELSMSQAMNYVNSKIVTNTKDSYLTKSLKNYGVYSVSDLGSSLLYSKLFDTSSKSTEDKLEELKKDPAFREEVKKLHKVLEEAKVDETLINRMDYIFTDKDFDEDKITPKDLESPEIKELFLELMAKDIYYENMGGVIQTGSTGLDRFAFSRLYGVVASTKGMAINLIIYNILCMGGVNPALAYLKAGSVYMIDNIITNYYYYKLRRQMINQ